MFFKQKNSFNKPKITLLAICLIVGVLITTATVTVLAKYVFSQNSAYKQIDTAKFYFLTDFDENDLLTPYDCYDGVVNFNIYNYDLLNMSTVNIDYEVFVDGTSYKTGQIEGNAKNYDAIAIGFSDSFEAKTYKVTVKATGPFIKEYNYYFRVDTHYADSFYTVTNHDDDGFVELDIYVGESDKSISVFYGSLQPDNTIMLIADWQAGINKTEVLTTITPHSHYKLIFFGKYDMATPFKLTQNHHDLQQGV